MTRLSRPLVDRQQTILVIVPCSLCNNILCLNSSGGRIQNLEHMSPGGSQDWLFGVLSCFGIFIAAFTLAPCCGNPLITAPAKANICHQNPPGFVTRPTGLHICHSCKTDLYPMYDFSWHPGSPMILSTLIQQCNQNLTKAKRKLLGHLSGDCRPDPSNHLDRQLTQNTFTEHCSLKRVGGRGI